MDVLQIIKISLEIWQILFIYLSVQASDDLLFLKCTELESFGENYIVHTT